MRVLVTFAVEAEFAPWRRLHSFRKEEFFSGGHSGRSSSVYRSEQGGNFLDVGFTGIGWRGLNEALTHLLTIKPDVWISSGLAGALRESAVLGDVVVPRVVLSGISDVESHANRLEIDEELHALALRSGGKDADSLLTLRQVLTKATEKKTQSARASVVDMESFDIVKEANKLGVRSLVIRAISDCAHEDLPIDFNRVLTSRREVSVPKVLVELAKNPFAIAAMIKFGMQSRRAAEILAIFLDNFTQSLVSVESLTTCQAVAQ